MMRTAPTRRTAPRRIAKAPRNRASVSVLESLARDVPVLARVRNCPNSRAEEKLNVIGHEVYGRDNGIRNVQATPLESAF